MNSPIGLFVAAAIVMLALAIGSYAWQAETASTVQHNADDLAHRWVNAMYPAEEARTARVTCQATDSDDNGYVSCTLMITHEHEEQLIPIECHAYVALNWGDTCRPLVPYGMGGRR
jgi:hypothetical protein